MPALSLLFFFIIQGSVLMVLAFYCKGMLAFRYNDAKNLAILGFFIVIDRAQLNAVHTKLLEKLRLCSFAETCQFQTIN